MGVGFWSVDISNLWSRVSIVMVTVLKWGFGLFLKRSSESKIPYFRPILKWVTIKKLLLCNLFEDLYEVFYDADFLLKDQNYHFLISWCHFSFDQAPLKFFTISDSLFTFDQSTTFKDRSHFLLFNFSIAFLLSKSKSTSLKKHTTTLFQ